MESFSADRMRAARERKGWSVGRLAAELGMRVASVATWDRGSRVPVPASFRQLVDVLEVEPEDLLTTPKAEWTLEELRYAAGFLQAEVAKAVGLPATRLSYIESAFEELSPDLTKALAEQYDTEEGFVRQCWENARRKLAAG